MTDDRLKLILEVDDKGFARVLNDAAKAGDRFEVSLDKMERSAKDAGDGLETGLFSKLNAGALLLGGFGLAATLATEAVTTLWRESAAEAEAAGRRTEAALSATFEGLESLGRRTFESREALLDAAQQQQQRVLDLEQQFRRDLGLGPNAPDILVRFNATAEGVFDGNIRASRALLEEERARLRVLQSELESYDDQGRELARLQQSGAEVVETEQKKNEAAQRTLSTLERQVQAVRNLQTDIEPASPFDGLSNFSEQQIVIAQSARKAREDLQREYESLNISEALEAEFEALSDSARSVDFLSPLSDQVRQLNQLRVTGNPFEALEDAVNQVDLATPIENEFARARTLATGFSLPGASEQFEALERDALSVDLTSGLQQQFNTLASIGSREDAFTPLQKSFAELAESAAGVNIDTTLSGQLFSLESLAQQFSLEAIEDEFRNINQVAQQVDITSTLEEQLQKRRELLREVATLPVLPERQESRDDAGFGIVGTALQELQRLDNIAGAGLLTSFDEAAERTFILRDALAELAGLGFDSGDIQFDTLKTELDSVGASVLTLSERIEAIAPAASFAFGSFAQLSQQAFEQSEGHSRAWFNFNKAALIAQATADTFAGANRALAQTGPFGIITGAAVIAAGLANVARIASTRIGGGTSSGSGGGSTSFNFSPFTAGNGNIETLARPADQSNDELRIVPAVLPSGDILLSAERGLERRARFGGSPSLQEGR